MPNNPIYFFQHNHFDPTWRRCWDRTFDYRGKRYRSYAELEERFIDIWLENAKQGALWSEGQALVFRKYLEKHPERLEEMRELVKQGLIELTAAGETVADTNLPSGETLLRNLAIGQWWFEETFGVIPTVGWLEDAFGQSAQMPQLFRGIECNTIQRLCYKRVPGDYWRGLDGSVIFIGEANNKKCWHTIKIAPCTECSGMGCERCGGSGQEPGMAHLTDNNIEEALNLDFDSDRISLVRTGGEETVPNPRIAELLEQARERGMDVRWGGYTKLQEHFADAIARADDPNIEASDQVEANPVFTGCYVSRIEVKQQMRRLENWVNTAERWATVAYLLGAEYPSQELTEIWRNTLFIAFHDAITSSHIDQAYYEIMDMMVEADFAAHSIIENALGAIETHISTDPDKDYLVIYNAESWERSDPVSVVISDTRGIPTLISADGTKLDILDAQAQGTEVHVTFRPPAIPALGYTAIEIKPDTKPIDRGGVTQSPGEIENEFYKITVSSKGITSIFDKRLGKETLDTSKYLANELILEEDIGHPWGTSQTPSFEERLSEHSTTVSIRKADKVNEVTLKGQYKGKDNNVDILTWKQTVKLYTGIDRIDFHTEIDWDTAHRRIKTAFPTNIATDEATYAIPYGALKRGSYEPEMEAFKGTNGDWPTVNWIDVYDEAAGHGMALLNTGTPSHKIKDGVIFMSLLRSPADAFALNEPEHYDCPDIDGARDSGRHEFTYSLIPHSGDYRAASIEKRGREFNNPMIVRDLSSTGEGKLGPVHSFLKLDAPDSVVVTAIKKAEKDDSVVVRLAETGGMDAEMSVDITGAGKKQSLVNFIERQPEPVRGKVKLTPFKIQTVKMSYNLAHNLPVSY